MTKKMTLISDPVLISSCVNNRVLLYKTSIYVLIQKCPRSFLSMIKLPESVVSLVELQIHTRPSLLPPPDTTYL